MQDETLKNSQENTAAENNTSEQRSDAANLSAEAIVKPSIDEAMDLSASANSSEEPAAKGRKAKRRMGLFAKSETDEKVKELEEKIKALEETHQKQQEEINEWKDKFLRLFSEFDNYKKRNARERIELTKTASADIIRKMLPVLDDLERALKSAGDDAALAPYRQGVELILIKMMGILEKEGLKPIEAKGQPFDTDYHEALTNIPAPSEELKGKVVDEIEKGYMLHDKVIRFAKVVVGS
ncbi:MAG: nucleotide exchange factor GrpE [Bacteroidales bacterium]